MKRRAIAVLVLLLGLAAAAWWWWSARAPKWSVLLITLDTTRADRLACYGYSGAITPNFDRLAADGALFERAYTVVPITLPAHATLHTGLLPPEHGLRINGTSRLPDSVPTLADILRARGYRTGAFVSSLVLDARFGLARGFETYDDRMGNGPGGPAVERSAADTVSAALGWLEDAASEPLFCWVHLYDPHDPYVDHPEEFGDRFTGRPYDAEIAYMDHHVGRLLDALPRLGIERRTIVVIAGDHGEGLGDHKEATHGYLAYNSTMHVPLILRHPAWEQPGLRIAEPVSLDDVFPTLLDGLQLPPFENLSGRSLQPYWKSAPLAPRACYGETQAPLMEGGWCPLRTWTTARWKYIQSTLPELYDLQADPHELHNLIDQHPGEAEQLSRELADFESQLQVREAAGAVLSAQEVRALAGLGYTGGQSPAEEPATPRRDIKETLVYAEQVHQCMEMIDRNELEAARVILERVVASLPDYPKAWGTLGVCLARQEDFPAAERHFRQALSMDENQNFARIGLGRVLFEQQRLEECVDQLQAAVAREPSALDAQYYLGEACRRLRRWDASREAFAAALEIAPGFVDAELGLGDLARDQGDFAAAADRYERVLQRDPSYGAAWIGLAQAQMRQGRDAEAARTFEALLERAPRHVSGLLEFARLLRTSGDPAVRNPERAVRLAERACRVTDDREPEALRALAAACAAAGRFNDAAEAAQAALTRARESDAASVAAEIERELNAYRSGAESR